ncbi:hypothetical protein NCAS_0B02470 [Naumovozyma castellii]|uniref:GID complex catalytic subunit 2 n=1 Tax=Naumovozyma castellii TaxID=27288 RepID=G0VBK5_NAUCA|nr:hypothetical protein NCAS_0B02470 [Naumovozyma castellii CBS 4309]CCC68331.1 hypothetical protein NCAS_0B02470 [Naumovozyma castellii CBS 4309]
MVALLQVLKSDLSKFYDDEQMEEPCIQKCLDDTHEFKTNLRKLKAHLNKQIQESQNADSSTAPKEDAKLKRRRSLIIEKLNKSHKQWEHSLKKNSKHVLQQQNKFHKNSLSKLNEFSIDQVYLNKIPNDSKSDIKDAIGYHISRYNIGNLPVSGKDEIMQYLKNVYGIDEIISNKFVVMGQIIQDLKKNNLNTCFQWCQENKTTIGSSQFSSLEFELYFLNALELIKVGNTVETAKYFIEGIPQDSLIAIKSDIISKVPRLLTQVILGQQIQDIDCLMEEQLTKCINLFTKVFCEHNNLTKDSPIFLITLSGLISFQYFIKYRTIRAVAHVDWTTKDELPFDVKLPDFLTHFHPIFICPVLKEETTEENPPYSLVCHHIISKKALDKLSKNGTITFKCPYCPVNSARAKTNKVKFIGI